MKENIVIGIWHYIKQIPIIGIPYKKLIGNRRLDNLNKKKSERIKKYGIQEIKKIDKALSEIVDIYFADCGTLLGVIRDNKLIEWDPDIDYGIVIDDSFCWEKLEKHLNDLGYKKLKEWTINGIITEQTYASDNLTIDIFGHFKSEKGLSFYCYSRVTGIMYAKDTFGVYCITTPNVDETYKHKLDNIFVNVPKNAEDYLEYIYNEDWRIPNPDWEDFTGKGCAFLEDMRGIIHRY